MAFGDLTPAEWHRRAATAAIALAALGLFAVAAFRLQPPAPPLDAHFPSSPTAADLEVLRDAYSGPPETWPRPRLLADAKFVEMNALQLHPRGQGNEGALARLGRELFEDPRLSASGHFACQSCHNRSLGWGDGLPTPFGHGRAKGKRNAQSLFAVGYKSTFFWDGRAGSLEEQALAPLANHREMANHDFVGLLQRINGSDHYSDAFAALTGENEVTLDHITSALATFQRTLERRTRFDSFMQGENRILSDTEIWGLHLFRTKAGCANCHNGPTLSDNRFHNLGLSYFNRKLEDLGRFGVTGDPQVTGRFLTPSLRHVSRTGPYMHNGVFPSLEGLIRLYEAGGGRVRADQEVSLDRQPLLKAVIEKSPQLKPFKLTPAERAALLAFLKAL
jgi:cytochrome c peroxidase